MDKGIQGVLEYTGYTRVSTGWTRVYRIYKGMQVYESIQGVATLGTRLYKVYGVYKSVQGIQGDTGCTKAYRVYKSIQGVQEYTRCTVSYRAYKVCITYFRTIHGVLHDILTIMSSRLIFQYAGECENGASSSFFGEGNSLWDGHFIILFTYFFHYSFLSAKFASHYSPKFTFLIG